MVAALAVAGPGMAAGSEGSFQTRPPGRGPAVSGAKPSATVAARLGPIVLNTTPIGRVGSGGSTAIGPVGTPQTGVSEAKVDKGAVDEVRLTDGWCLGNPAAQADADWRPGLCGLQYAPAGQEGGAGWNFPFRRGLVQDFGGFKVFFTDRGGKTLQAAIMQTSADSGKTPCAGLYVTLDGYWRRAPI